MATPSSKPNPGATPTYLTSSPRPSGTHMGRPIAYKSPSTRTPSASGHGHGHQTSVSSHPYATPLAATTGIEDAVAFSSPSALLALGGYSGISPSPAGHDALVGPGMNEHDIQALGMQGIKLGSVRDNDEERRRHIEDVVQLLWTRIAGRAICREGIERLGQLESFESIWQEDSLNIAGNFVDLEIEFYRGQNVVKDVSLNYLTPEATDSERREEATAVLKRDLVQSPEDGDRGLWKSLTGFHGNLQWLSKHDRLSQEVNCFEAIEGLYASLKRVWDEEQKLPKFSREYEHLCAGSIGRPGLHRGNRLGLSLDYWVHQARVLDAKHPKVSSDAMVIDQPITQATDDDSGPQNGKWYAMVECEEGYPSLRISKEWVGSEVLTVVNGAENGPSSSETAASDIAVINWVDPPPTMSSVSQGSSEAMGLDPGMLGSSTPNRRFVARMEPPLDVPILTASDIYRHLGIQLPHEFRMVTYDGLLVPGWSPLGGTEADADDSTQPSRRRRRTSVQGFDQEGKPCMKHHSYTFQAFESVAGRTIRDIPFSHPRQLADIFPILRQYALLANLVHKIFNPPHKDGASKEDAHEGTGQSSRQQNASMPKMPTKKNKVIVLSNKDPNERKLGSMLNGQSKSTGSATGIGEDIPISSTKDAAQQEDVKVDVTLRTQLGQSPVVMLLFTVEDPRLATPGGSTLSKVSISLEIGLNGRISVVDMTGLLENESTANDKPDAQPTDGQSNEAYELQAKIAKVLEVSQDIGILVEWVSRWVRQQRDVDE